jgi:hypothetical protein
MQGSVIVVEVEVDELDDINIANERSAGCSLVHSLLDLSVEERDHSGESTSDDIGDHTLVHSGETFLSEDDSSAINGTLVESLLHGLLRFHLDATTDSVEGVVEGSGGDSGNLGGEESSDESNHTRVLLVGVESHDGVEETELESSVDNNTGNGSTESVVDGGRSVSGGGLLEAIEDTVEGLFFTTDIRGESGSGEIEGVADGEGESSSETSRGEVDSEESPEVCLGVVSGEHLLDGVLERKVEGLLREVSHNIGSISSPEGRESLLGSDTSEAISHTLVSLDLSRDNLGVSILSLDEELNTLDGGSGSLGKSSNSSSNHEILKPGDDVVAHICVIKNLMLIPEERNTLINGFILLS